ncbi:MAG TPA: mechanosensitive ion channel domain-containing protein [Terriglobales bacterium]|nr:mechanosensitive ion channel domain-containing protein [Terriglobales bacterium]
MHSRVRTFVLVGLLIVAGAVTAGIWYTSKSDQNTTLAWQRSRNPAIQQVWASQRSFEAARQLARLAETRDEERLAREALQGADDELDLAYTTALREAQLNPAPPSEQSKELRARIRQLEDDVKAGNLRVIELSADINSGKSKDIEATQREMDLVGAQLTLHAEELEDAKRDLARASDDPETRVRRLLEAHKASYHTAAAEQPVTAGRLPMFSVPSNLVEQTRLLKSLRSKRSQLEAAQQTAATTAKTLQARREDVAKKIQAPGQLGSADPKDKAQVAARLAELARISEQRTLIADYDRRENAQQQLSQTYGSWINLLSARQVAVWHGILKSVLYLLVLVILMVLAEIGIDRYLSRSKADRRKVVTMRMLSRFAVRFVCFLAILLAIFGSPKELTTIIGLATAGLTVALKDFIIAFLGWFVIMGRNGIRVGDWVEINGISGEVAEIGLFRTVLLETGNFADPGHPTGRRVTFVNSFAIERHFFNFSTVGQWLWDTLEVLVPNGQDPQEVVDSIRNIVIEATAESTRQAENEWQRVTHRYGVQPFSAEPNIDMRPTAQGVILNVRYITRANQRYDLRSRLYQSIVELLQQRQRASAMNN